MSNTLRERRTAMLITGWKFWLSALAVVAGFWALVIGAFLAGRYLI
jgi:hypothetical protein